ncbi:MAG TPA: bi-domain-containing oxidoreductase [Candidatus Kapabacteria bacterium]|nr:bi-domain-containing oxidoreductase [Candidatus Kapabacteria bacterium]
MLQAYQYQKSGELHVKDVPAPELRNGMIVVRTCASLISAGTERNSVMTAKASMIEKVRMRPDLVKQVLETARREGVMSTMEKVRTRLDNYKALGYSASGVVMESGCDEFSPGDRVACAVNTGAHAEVIAVPRNLAVRIPDGVSFDEAAFTTLGAIAIQGVRQARVALGESVAVIGLGLLGQITVQLLKAAGCRVIGLDTNQRQFDLARRFGADAVVPSDASAVGAIESFTRGIGCDAVIITASTLSNDPIELAIKAARTRARVVVVGAVGMELPRAGFYEKELEITISCSFGPGRYDPRYEEEGIDYPVGFVRWTERRNMESVLDLIASGRLQLEPIITHRFPIADAERAYDLVTGKVDEPYLGILLTYPDRGVNVLARALRVGGQPPSEGQLGVGFIGAGKFAQSYLLPPARTAGVRMVSVATATAVNARATAEKYGFAEASTDPAGLIARADIGAVFIATRHDSHGEYVRAALEAGKQVFVEKPLAVTKGELQTIREIGDAKNDRVMVGFNRRFSESFRAMKRHFENVREPLVMLYRVNAGFIKLDHWTQQESQGGRIVGEGCHFIDCMQFLAGARPVSVYAAAIGSDNRAQRNADSVSITIRFSDGSVGTLLYLANGDSSVGKEYCEVFGGGHTAIMDNFRAVHLASGNRRKTLKFNGDKGHSEEVARTLAAMKEGAPMPISFQSLCDTTLATLAALDSLAAGGVIALGEPLSDSNE